jgi:hypothetical protein
VNLHVHVSVDEKPSYGKACELKMRNNKQIYMVQVTVATNCFLENMALYEICAELLYQSIDVYTHIYIFKAWKNRELSRKQ